jgi:protease IV
MRFLLTLGVLCCLVPSIQAQPLPAAQARLLYDDVGAGQGLADPVPFLGRTLNPASIGLVESPQVLIKAGNRGIGGSLGLSLLGAFRLGIGVDRLAPDEETHFWRTSLDLGLSPSRSVHMGFSFHTLSGTRETEGKAPVDAGLLIRPVRWLSFGLVGRNINEVDVPGHPTSQLSTGIATRPGVDWLTLGVDLTTDRDFQYLDPTAYLAVEPWEGVKLGATGYMRDDPCAGMGWGVGSMLTINTPFSDMYGGYAHSDNPSADDWFGAMRFSALPEKTVVAPRGYVVRYTLPGRYPEAPAGGLFSPASKTLLGIRTTLARMAADPEVDGVVVTIRPMAIGWAQAQEMAESLHLLRKKGKKVVVYLQGGGNKEYYIASRASRLFISPGTTIQLRGIRAGLTFLKDMLALIGVEAQFVRIGKYKSFPEQYTRSEPSPEYKKATIQLRDDFFGQLTRGIARGRGVSPEQVEAWIDDGPFTANQALKAKLVDDVRPIEELEKVLVDAGLPDRKASMRYPLRKYRDDTWGLEPRLAVLVIQGAIVDGGSFTMPLVGMKMVGAATVVNAIRAIEKDRSIEGVLVRVDSRGGAALGSELINRALARLATKKKVVVSLGNTAASGGYYVAVAGHRIVAMPGTVTGSIGIFFGKAVVSGLLDKLKIHRFNLDRGKSASILDSDYKLTDAELAKVKLRMQELYDLFVQRVVAGRPLKTSEVETLAQGRVYSGTGALGAKLVDKKGGVYESFLHLKSAVGIPVDRKVSVVYYPRRSLGQLLQEALSGGAVGKAGLGAELDALMENLEAMSRTYNWAIDPWIEEVATP